MAKTAKQIAKAAKKKSETLIGQIKPKVPGGGLNPDQKARVERLKNTIRTADIAIEAATDAGEIEHASRALDQRNELMDERSRAMVAVQNAIGNNAPASTIANLRQNVFDAGLKAQAFGDQVRLLESRQMGQGTAYTGPGAQIQLDAEGKPQTTSADVGGVPKGSLIYHIDPEAYVSRFRPQFQPTQEQLDRAGGPGAWAQGLLSGGDDFTYLTPWQQTNFQWMLEDADGGILGDAGGLVNLPSQWRTDWRTEEWGDQWDEATQKWTQAEDPLIRQAAVEDQLRRYNEGLFNPGTGQPLESTGPPAWPDSPNPFRNTTTTNLNNRTQVTSPFQHPYAADSYTVPHMQTGAEWEGLGAEYQPGTVEGLGLLAGEPSAPYEPLARSLLDASPSFMGTPSGFEPMNFEGGLAGETETSNNAWTPTWQFTNVNGAQQYGYFNQGGQWVRGGDQR